MSLKDAMKEIFIGGLIGGSALTITVFLSYILLSVVGGVIFYCIFRLAIRTFCPEPPKEVLALLHEVETATLLGDWYDDSDIYRLDKALMEAEMKKPGSTLSLYLDLPQSRVGMALGSVMISSTVNGWMVNIFPINFLTVILLIFGLVFLFSPFFLWSISRPMKR